MEWGRWGKVEGCVKVGEGVLRWRGEGGGRWRGVLRWGRGS